MDKPVRIQLKRTKGWRMPPNTVKVTRPGKWGNPFNFLSSEHCWTALSYGCRGDRLGRIEASVKAFREWIYPGKNLQTKLYERRVGFGNDKKILVVSPEIKIGSAPSLSEIKAELR